MEVLYLDSSLLLTGFPLLFPFEPFSFGIWICIFKAKAEAHTPDKISMPSFSSDFGDIQDHSCSRRVMAFLPVHQVNQLDLFVPCLHQLRQFNGSVDCIKLPLSSRGQLPEGGVLC